MSASDQPMNGLSCRRNRYLPPSNGSKTATEWAGYLVASDWQHGQARQRSSCVTPVHEFVKATQASVGVPWRIVAAITLQYLVEHQKTFENHS